MLLLLLLLLLLPLSDDRDELGLKRFFFFFFNLSEHHILHLLAYKSPSAVCLKAPLASSSVNLFVVHLSNGV